MYIEFLHKLVLIVVQINLNLERCLSGKIPSRSIGVRLTLRSFTVNLLLFGSWLVPVFILFSQLDPMSQKFFTFFDHEWAWGKYIFFSFQDHGNHFNFSLDFLVYLDAQNKKLDFCISLRFVCICLYCICF